MPVTFRGCFITLLFLLYVNVLSAGDWPQWRGPNRDGHAAPDEAPLSSIAKDPKVLWRIETGGSFSSPVVAAGKLAYIDGQDSQEVAHLVDAQNGKELWRVPFASIYQDEWGAGARSTPYFDQDRLYVLSCNGEFRCLNVSNGNVIWGTSFEKDFAVKFLGSKAEEGTASRRGNNGCGIVDGDRLFLAVGSTKGASLVAFDKLNGKVLWKSQNDEAAYSSLVVATLAGTKQIIYFSADSLMGLAPDSGKLLWRVPLTTAAKRHAATPVVFGDRVIVNSHTFGLDCFRIKKEGNDLSATLEWQNRQMKINIATPVLVDHYLYSQGPGREMVCVDGETGKLMWSHDGFGEKVSAGIAVGKTLLFVTDRGELVAVAADGSKYSELARVQVSGKTWNHPAYSNGKLYVREGLTSNWKLTCYDFRPGT